MQVRQSKTLTDEILGSAPVTWAYWLATRWLFGFCWITFGKITFNGPGLRDLKDDQQWFTFGLFPFLIGMAVQYIIYFVKTEWQKK